MILFEFVSQIVGLVFLSYVIWALALLGTPKQTCSFYYISWVLSDKLEIFSGISRKALLAVQLTRCEPNTETRRVRVSFCVKFMKRPLPPENLLGLDPEFDPIDFKPAPELRN